MHVLCIGCIECSRCIVVAVMTFFIGEIVMISLPRIGGKSIVRSFCIVSEKFLIWLGKFELQ